MVKFPEIINHVYLMVTEQCPLRCEYCYIKDRETANEFPIEWVEHLKNAFTCCNKPKIVFFGGEPLLKTNLIKQIVELYNDTFQFQVVTNGVVNFNKFMDEVYEPYKDLFDVQISWDGELNTRTMINGSSTFSTVYDNIITNLKKDRILVGRCVLNETSVKNFYQTFLTFKELNSLYKFGADFTIAHQPNFKDSFYEDLTNQLELVLCDIKNHLFDDKQFIPNIILKWIDNITTNKSVISCDVGNYIVVRPTGDLYPCTILSQMGDEFKLGNLLDKQIDTELITHIKYETSCSEDCSFKAICDGGCRYERVINFKNDWEKNICKYNCSIMKVIYESITKFLNSLSDNELDQLHMSIMKYDLWGTDYGNGKLTNKNKRLL